MKLISLGSGSSGNFYFISHENHALIIDSGVAIRQLSRNIRSFNLPMHQVEAILVTHDHWDHVRTVAVLSKQYRIPVYASQEVFRGMNTNPRLVQKVPETLRHPFSVGDSLEIGPYKVATFDVPHDASRNNGYYITTAGASLCLMTDIGHITDELRTYIRQSENLIIEANYDLEMLERGRYPQFLKDRIKSGIGHLSNTQTAAVLTECLSDSIKQVWLCHLSEENNRPEKALSTVGESLASAGLSPQLRVLPRRNPSGIFEL
ncbi:MAG: MBL fold metallo-hydrolase [Alloprevotella sp.]|nr:MBL fold metallo-hydrolase [Alloprevotella sp.]